MNRAKSITDIRDIYLEMQRKNSTSTIDESFLYESTSNKKSQTVKAKEPKNTFPKSTDSVKEPSTFKKGGPNNVKNLTKPKKNKKFSQKSKKMVKENINNFMSIFDKLYENVMKSDELDIDTGIGTGPEGDLNDSEELDMDSSSDSENTNSESPKEMLQKAIDLLQQVADSMEDESETESDLEALGVDSEDEDEEGCDDDDDEDEDVKYETTELEKLPDSTGHKLTKAGTVGNIKASSGKADSKVTDEVGTETGKHPLDHKSELTNRAKDKVGSLKVGKNLFD
jgi:hypothetical protein